jgi:hypothetical protein
MKAQHLRQETALLVNIALRKPSMRTSTHVQPERQAHPALATPNHPSASMVQMVNSSRKEQLPEMLPYVTPLAMFAQPDPVSDKHVTQVQPQQADKPLHQQPARHAMLESTVRERDQRLHALEVMSRRLAARAYAQRPRPEHSRQTMLPRLLLAQQNGRSREILKKDHVNKATSAMEALNSNVLKAITAHLIVALKQLLVAVMCTMRLDFGIKSLARREPSAQLEVLLHHLQSRLATGPSKAQQTQAHKNVLLATHAHRARPVSSVNHALLVNTLAPTPPLDVRPVPPENTAFKPQRILAHSVSTVIQQMQQLSRSSAQSAAIDQQHLLRHLLSMIARYVMQDLDAQFQDLKQPQPHVVPDTSALKAPQPLLQTSMSHKAATVASLQPHMTPQTCQL